MLSIPEVPAIFLLQVLKVVIRRDATDANYATFSPEAGVFSGAATRGKRIPSSIHHEACELLAGSGGYDARRRPSVGLNDVQRAEVAMLVGSRKLDWDLLFHESQVQFCATRAVCPVVLRAEGHNF